MENRIFRGFIGEQCTCWYHKESFILRILVIHNLSGSFFVDPVNEAFQEFTEWG